MLLSTLVHVDWLWVCRRRATFTDHGTRWRKIS
jgi:hypothetical protein